MAYILVMHPTNRLRELRKRAGLSQTDLAERTGVSQPRISQIENDESPLTVDWMRTFARELGCVPADLLAPQDNPYSPSNDERALLDHYRLAPDSQRELVHRVAEPAQGYRAPPLRAA